ncbi:unnamed protein product, partial [Cuscuta europaea]
MKRYWATVPSPGSSNNNASNIASQCSSSIPKQVDLDELPSDPAKRRKISEYHPNQIDEIRRKYLIKGPCQPRGHDFPQKEIVKNEYRIRLNASIDVSRFLLRQGLPYRGHDESEE